LAGVAGVVLADGATQQAAAQIARQLEGLFVEVLCLEPQAIAGDSGEDGALAQLVRALEAAQAARVLVVSSSYGNVTRDLLLALVAWPEADAVVPRTQHGSQPLCALYRSAALLPVAREQLAAGHLELQPLLERVGASYLDEAELALVDPGGSALVPVATGSMP
jgi:molybdopterin-guanine dinucleotide biosynthesis protein A